MHNTNSYSYSFCFSLTHTHFPLCWVMNTRNREQGLISVCRFPSCAAHSDPCIHRSQRPSCRQEASEAAHRQARALLWTCSSLIEKPWEPHINHVLMYTALISQAATCCQQVMLTLLFRAVMRSREQTVWKWAEEHSVAFICSVVGFFFPLQKLE